MTAYVDALYKLARTAVDVDAGFGCLGAAIRSYLTFIAVDSYISQSPINHWGAG
jgi:hypothetical protein